MDLIRRQTMAVLGAGAPADSSVRLNGRVALEGQISLRGEALWKRPQGPRDVSLE